MRSFLVIGIIGAVTAGWLGVFATGHGVLVKREHVRGTKTSSCSYLFGARVYPTELRRDDASSCPLLYRFR